MSTVGSPLAVLLIALLLVSSVAVVAAAPRVNHPPIAKAGPGQTVATGSTATLDGSGSTDAEGALLTYWWVLVSRPAGSFASLENLTDVNPKLVVDVPGNYVIALVVNDGSLDSAPDFVTISTTNSPPVAKAGRDQTTAIGATIRLDGSGSSDADGDRLHLRWSLSRPNGSVAVLTDPTGVAPTFVPDLPGSYVVQLIVDDGIYGSAPDTVTISTTNSAPVANAGASQTVSPGSEVLLNGSGSTDADGDSLTYAWSMVSRPTGSLATLSDPSAVLPTLWVDKPGTYVVQLIVNDGIVSSAADTTTVSTRNTPPVAKAGRGRSAAVGEPVLLDGSASSDADGDVLTYRWAFTAKPADSIANLAGSETPSPSFLVDRPGTYVVQLMVRDGLTDSRPATVRITTANSPPAADAGPDQLEVPAGDDVTLDGTLSRDPDGGPLTYGWSFISRPPGSNAILTGADGPTPIFTPDVAGDYVVQLTVHDGAAASPPDTVLIRAVHATAVVNVRASDPEASETGPDPGTFTFTRTGPTRDSLNVFYSVGGYGEQWYRLYS